jgi:hypothetical protein
VANIIEDTKPLIKAGFENVCAFNGAKMLRNGNRENVQGEVVVPRES